MKRIIITESQFKKYILGEDVSLEGWRRDIDTNKIYWTGTKDDKYEATHSYRWVKLNDTPKYWGHKQPVEEYPSLKAVTNPRPNQVVKITRGRDGGKYFKYTNKNENLVMVPISNPTRKEKMIGLQNIFKSETSAKTNPKEGSVIYIDNNSKRGFYKFERPSNGDTYAFGADTRILNYDENNKPLWNVKVRPLEKTGINSYHFIGLPTFDLTKSMKHGKIKSGKQNSKETIDVTFDRKTISEFASYMRTYVWHFLKSYNGNGFLPIDIIATPESTGKLNDLLVSQLKKMLPNAKIMRGLFEKDIENMYLDRDIMDKKGREYSKKYIREPLTDQQRRTLESNTVAAIEYYLNEFEKDRQLSLAKKIVIEIEKMSAENKDVSSLQNELENKILQYYKGLNYSPIYNKGIVKKSNEISDMQIKKLHQVARYALKNFFKLTNIFDKKIEYTDKYGKLISKTIPVEEQLKNKRILLVNDNFSSGGTLDNICELLIKVGVKKNDIIPITLGVTKEAYASGADKFNPRGI